MIETAIPIPTKEVFETISWALCAAIEEFGDDGLDVAAREWLDKVERAVTYGSESDTALSDYERGYHAGVTVASEDIKRMRTENDLLRAMIGAQDTHNCEHGGPRVTNGK